MDELIISVFYDVDNFCKKLNSYFQHYFLSHDGKNIFLEVPETCLGNCLQIRDISPKSCLKNFGKRV